MSESGLSLVEVLVSLALLSLASISGFILIDSLSRAHTRLDERYARLEAVKIFLADFSQDVSSAESVTLAPGGDALTLGTKACKRTIQYSVQSGSLIREAPGCPEYRFELRGISKVQFAVVRAARKTDVAPSLQSDLQPAVRAVRIDLTFDDQAPGLNLHKIVDLPEGPAP